MFMYSHAQHLALAPGWWWEAVMTSRQVLFWAPSDRPGVVRRRCMASYTAADRLEASHTQTGGTRPGVGVACRSGLMSMYQSRGGKPPAAVAQGACQQTHPSMRVRHKRTEGKAA